MRKGVTFNNRHCSELNLTMLKPKRPLLPETKDTYIDIPHRDGSILIPDRSARDIFIEIEFLLKQPNGVNIYDAARNVGAWLTTGERKPLIFDDDPNYKYNAKVVGNIELEKVVNWRTFTVVFRCEPYPVEI